MDIKVGDKVFFELDDMEGVRDLTSGKEYEVFGVQPDIASIQDDELCRTAISTSRDCWTLAYKASWQKVQ